VLSESFSLRIMVMLAAAFVAAEVGWASIQVTLG
jgi:hypothetical protein